LDLNIDDFKFKPYCTRASSPFIYIPADHVITDVLKMIDNTSLGVVFAQGPQYREAKSIN